MENKKNSSELLYYDSVKKDNNSNEDLFVSNSLCNIEEKIINPIRGCYALPLIIIFALFNIGMSVLLGFTLPYLIEIPLLFLIFSFICFCGLYTNVPNEAVVFMFCGSYKGTVKKNGYFFSNPFYSKTVVSLKSKTLNSPIVKVSDKSGNPINIGTVIVWHVNEWNKALFNVENLNSFIIDQTESTIRKVCCHYNYDKRCEDDISLRSGDESIQLALEEELSRRVKKAGVVIEEARITELSYSSEISNTMLKKQAAESLVAAREKIVRGAVDIVQQTMIEMETKNICKMDDDDKARIVGDLMVTLCSDNSATPIISGEI